MASKLKQRLENQQAAQGIDMSPLIDVVFILLIFFIVTTVFVRETGVDVDKPQALSASALEKNVILIAITAEGNVVYDGSNVGVVGVRSIIEQSNADGERPVVVQADKQVPTEQLIAVIDEVKLAGVSNVSIASLKP
ncbi:MAG: biopolymer transporter ExbD [Thalassotalea sp.]|nr:biopolymer transporter ExbD [Thalassotalea sp.]